MQHVVYFGFTKQAIVDSGNDDLQDWTALVYKHTEGELTEPELEVVKRVATNHAYTFYPGMLRSAEEPLYMLYAITMADYMIAQGEDDIDKWPLSHQACWFDTVIEDVHDKQYW